MEYPTEIALKAFKHGSREFEPGDRFPTKHHVDRGSLDERQVTQFRNVGLIGPLSRDNYALVMARRPAGAVGAGFTIDELVELGIVEKPKPAPKAEKKPQPEQVPKASHKAKEPPTNVPRTQESVEHGAYWITSRPRGSLPPTYVVTDKDGVLARPAGFMTLDKAKAFIDTLAAAPLAA